MKLVAGMALALAVMGCASTGGMVQGRPSRTVPMLTAEAARDQVVAWCISRGAQIDRADINQVVCSRDAGAVAGALLTTGVGPRPRHQFIVQFAPTPEGLYVTGWQRLQAYSFTGAESLREDQMTAQQYGQVQQVLSGLVAQ